MEQKIDVLNRDTFVREVIDILETLSSNKTGCCFAIDGKWGSGKTFVLDMLKEQIRDITSQETSDNKYFLFNYNCWKYDYYEEPSIAIVSSIMDSIDEEFKAFSVESDEKISAAWEVAKQNIGKIAGKFIENHIGINIVEVYHDIKDEHDNSQKQKREFDALFSFTQTLESTRELLQEIAQEKTFVLMVDELDRCIPSYAIKVLERLHHIFDGIDNTIVIIAIDSEQLEHSVKEIYGEKVNVDRYLKKFISFKKHLSIGKVNQDILEKYKSYISKFISTSQQLDELSDDLHQILSGIDIRHQEKIISKAEMIHSLICPCKKDISLLLFEILIVRYEHLAFNKNLRWLAELADENNTKYPSIEKSLGDHYSKTLKPLCQNALTGSYASIYTPNSNYNPHIIKDNLIGKSLWLLSAIYSEFNIYFSNSAELKELLPIAQNFKTMIDSIS